MQTGLAGKVVVVTAATANMGRGIALAFAAEGARLVITGRDPVAGELVARLAREQGAADVLWRPAAMTVGDEVAGMVADTLAAFGHVELLVNTVGGNVAVTPLRVVDPRAVADRPGAQPYDARDRRRRGLPRIRSGGVRHRAHPPGRRRRVPGLNQRRTA